MNFDIPSLNALHTFESAARHLSFKLAAEELHLTPSAVSKQIRLLEENLGYRLFHRLTRQLILTEEGKQLIKVVSSALSLIADHVEVLPEEESDRILKLSVPPSFAMKWLIPRLGKFKSQYPEIILNVEAVSKYIDLREEGVDLTIRYAKEEDQSAFHVVPMMSEELFPVCSPLRLEKGPPIKQVEDLLHHCLLHTSEKSRWPAWFEAVGYPNLSPKNEMYFNRADMAVQAVVEGQGIMIARAALVGDDISAGRLTRLFDFPVNDEKSYSIHCLKEQKEKDKIVNFREWLLGEAADFKKIKNGTP